MSNDYENYASLLEKRLVDGVEIDNKFFIVYEANTELLELLLIVFDFIGEKFQGDAGKEVIERLRERLAEKG